MDLELNELAPHTITGLSLCSGIGGIELGLRQVYGSGYQTVCYVEGELHSAATIASRMQAGAICEAPIWSNLKTFDPKPWRGTVDIISAGYPCQPFSVAGKRKGTEDPRHLWPYIANTVAAIEPALIFCENVPGHLAMGFEQVCQELQGMGYSVEAGVFSAAELGAPHLRKRLFFIAYSDGSAIRNSEGVRWKARIPAKPQYDGHEGLMAHGSCKQTPGQRGRRQRAEGQSASIVTRDGRAREMENGNGNFRGAIHSWATEPGLGRVADGIPYRLDRLRALGNAVVPAVAANAFTTLLERI